MSNRLKMVTKEVLYTLFSQNWSIRKINKDLNIHRKTISRYYKEWLSQQQTDKDSFDPDIPKRSDQKS